MRPIDRGPIPKDVNDKDIQYSDYAHARGELIRRLGEYCSYCEMHLDTSLAVEHVQPKKPAGIVLTGRELDWHNFLLACTNCNSTKGNFDVDLHSYFWPDRDNTFLALKYAEGGLISPADGLNPDLHQLALNTIQLTGLDKQPGNDPEASDRRWENRREAWDMAQRAKQRLQQCDSPLMREQIVETANAYWSVWMTVFQDDADMLQRLIRTFPGTCRDCFDRNNGYRPSKRARGLC